MTFHHYLFNYYLYICMFKETQVRIIVVSNKHKKND